MIRIEDIKLDYKDVLLVPQPSVEKSPNSRSQVDVNALYNVRNMTWISTPIIAANMDHVGTFEMTKALGKFNTMTALVKHYNLKDLLEFYKSELLSGFAIYSMGISEDDLNKFKSFHSTAFYLSYGKPIIVCVDVANAYTNQFKQTMRQLTKDYKNYIWMAGNVCTPQGVSDLIMAGVDIVKVGIGPGSACSTRRETGVGYPQFSAVLECAEQAKKMNKMICADGGIESPGDVVKALAAGASFVMIGGQFAGHDEGYTENQLYWIKKQWKDGGPYNLPFYGMASRKAQDIHNGGLADYRSSEGKEFEIPARGPIENTIKHYLGGLRSACLYQGIDKVMDLSKSPTFVKVSRQMSGVFDGYQC